MLKSARMSKQLRLETLIQRSHRIYLRLSQILEDRLATAEASEIHSEAHAQAAALLRLAADLRRRATIDEELAASAAEVLGDLRG